MNKGALDEEVKPPTGRPQHHQDSFSTPLLKMDFLFAQFTPPEEQQGEGEGREEEREEEEGEKGDEGKEEEGRLEWCGRGNGKVA